MSRPLIRLVVLLLLAHAAAAQNRWIVGPGGFPSLHAAYQAAAPGDTIIIRLPTDTLTILDGKGVSIVSDLVQPPVLQTTHLRRPTPFRHEAQIRNVPFGQVMWLRNLRIEGSLSILDCQGGIVLDRIVTGRSIEDTYGVGVEIFQCEDVLARDCAFRGNAYQGPNCRGGATGSAAGTANSRIAFVSCEFRDGPTGLVDCGAPSGPQMFTSYGVTVLDGELNSGDPRRIISLIGCTFIGPSAPEQIDSIRADLDLSENVALRNILARDSILRVYGTSYFSVMGSATVIRDARPLPHFDASLRATSLDVAGGGSVPGESCLIGFAVSPDVQAMSTIGHHGFLVLGLAPGQGGLLDVAIADGTGRWSRSYPVTPAMFALLRDQHFVMQALAVAADGRVWCSSWDGVRF